MAGAAGMVAVGGKAQAADKIAEILESTDPFRHAAEKLAQTLSAIFAKVAPEKLAGNPDAEGDVMNAENEYLNLFAMKYGLAPDARTSGKDAEAFTFAIKELKKQKISPRVLEYLNERLLEEIIEDKDERERLQEDMPRSAPLERKA